MNSLSVLLRHLRLIGIVSFLVLIQQHTTVAQEKESAGEFPLSWCIQQALPSYSWTSFSKQTNFAFEWEAAPIIYSFGMNRLDPKWHFFKVTQPERFAGSVEMVISAQLYTSKIGTSHWGFSGQVLAHFPLIEYGEYLGLNLGAARYNIAGIPSDYLIGGFSTFFGFLHYNLKYSPSDKIWINAIEFRFF